MRKLLVVEPDRAYCQPCLSPIWDTGLAGHAMAEAGGDTNAPCAWLRERQILDVVGDWAVRRPGLRPGGWAFQYANPHYPDVDDTAVVGMLLHRNGDSTHAEAIERAREWIIGMQSSDGGWGAFEPENTHLYLNNIPFADHGALLDPPTADVTARCVSFLAQIGMPADDPVLVRALGFLRREQEPEGSWFGRWGTNYIYGTWSVLCAFNAAGIPPDDPAVRRATAWLLAVQREDGGWGEDEETYRDAPHGRYKESTPSQTAWALLGLMAAERSRPPGGGAGHRLPDANAVRRWRVARAAVQRRGFSARILPALSRLPLVFPVAGIGALPQPAPRQHAQGGVWLLIRRSAWSSAWRQRHGSRDAWVGLWRWAAEPRRARRPQRGASPMPAPERWSASAWRAGSIRRCGRAH